MRSYVQNSKCSPRIEKKKKFLSSAALYPTVACMTECLCRFGLCSGVKILCFYVEHFSWVCFQIFIYFPLSTLIHACGDGAKPAHSGILSAWHYHMEVVINFHSGLHNILVCTNRRKCGGEECDLCRKSAERNIVSRGNGNFMENLKRADSKGLMLAAVKDTMYVDTI